MRLLDFSKLPHKINAIWALMLIPLAAVTVFSTVIVVRLPEFTSSFTSYWDFHKQTDVLGQALRRTRQAHVLLNESNNSGYLVAFESSIMQVKEGLDRFKGNTLFDELDRDVDDVNIALTNYGVALADTDAVLSRMNANTHQAHIAALRSDLPVTLDPLFIESANRIFEISQVFICESRLVASREFRDRIEVLRGRLDRMALPVDVKIRIQSNVNNLRGGFAELLLACQDLERAQETAEAAYEETISHWDAFTARIDGFILSSIDKYIASETRLLAVLSGIVLLFFLGGFAATLLFSSRFSRQLAAIIEAIRSIANGKRNTMVPFLGEKNEFGEIAGHIERFRLNAIVLDEAVIAARNANEAKTQFLATMSHELRTPLNAILGFSEIIRDGILGAVPPVYGGYAKDIYASAETLLEQISQILDLSKIELGRHDIDPVANDLSVITQIALRRLEKKIESKGLQVTWRTMPSHPALFDSGHLVQVVTNILDNAVKYNRQGGSIQIAIGQAGERISLTVSDSGIGMSEDQVLRAHEPFVQFGGSTDSLQGVGLGLSIVTRLLEANRGEMRISSRKGHGTEVTVLLPIASMMAERSVA